MLPAITITASRKAGSRSMSRSARSRSSSSMDAENIISGSRFQRCVVCHDRHSCNEIIPRLIQAFTVPTGAFISAAISPCENSNHVRKKNGFAPRRIELPEATLQALGFRKRHIGLLRIAAAFAEGGELFFIDKIETRTIAQHVEGAVAHDCRQPGACGTSFGVEARRTLPDDDECILHGFLGQFAAPQNPPRNGKQATGFAGEQVGKRTPVAASDLLQQRVTGPVMQVDDCHATLSSKTLLYPLYTRRRPIDASSKFFSARCIQSGRPAGNDHVTPGYPHFLDRDEPLKKSTTGDRT
jgi:hypothetical protein